MRAVSSGAGGTGCGRRSDMGDLQTRDHPTPGPSPRLPISPTVSDRYRTAATVWYLFLFGLNRLSGSVRRRRSALVLLCTISAAWRDITQRGCDKLHARRLTFRAIE